MGLRWQMHSGGHPQRRPVGLWRRWSRFTLGVYAAVVPRSAISLALLIEGQGSGGARALGRGRYLCPLPPRQTGQTTDSPSAAEAVRAAPFSRPRTPPRS